VHVESDWIYRRNPSLVRPAQETKLLREPLSASTCRITCLSRSSVSNSFLQSIDFQGFVHTSHTTAIYQTLGSLVSTGGTRSGS
jgi:hypothetical protein